MAIFVSKTRIVNAISKGNTALLKEILGVRPEYSEMLFKWEKVWTGTLLHCASYYNQPEVIKFLVQDKYLDVNKRDKDLGTALHDACRRNAYESAKLLIELGADVTIESSEGKSPLNLCKTEKMIRLVRNTIKVREEKYIEEKERNKREQEIKKFIKAISEGDIEALKAVLNRVPEIANFNIKWSGSWNGTVLHCAAYYNQPEVIKFFLQEKYLDVNKRDKDLGTALHDACNRNAYESAEMLLELDADPSIETSRGESVLDFCKHKKIKSLISSALETLLLKNKQAINKKQEQRPKADTGEDTEAEQEKEEWKTRGSYEIIHEYKLTDSDYKITDIFNFKARYWKSITQDIVNNTLAQETKFFDEIPDKEIVHEARENFNSKFGGNFSSNVVDSLPLRGKPRIK